jgi:hypothetical protein
MGTPRRPARSGSADPPDGGHFGTGDHVPDVLAKNRADARVRRLEASPRDGVRDLGRNVRIELAKSTSRSFSLFARSIFRPPYSLRHR